MAIESAIELARCLRDLPYTQAFAAYENLRRERVTRIIKLAARTNSHKAAGPITRRLRDVIMPMAMKLAKPEKTAWQYNHHIDWDAPATDTVTRRPRLTETARVDVAPLTATAMTDDETAAEPDHR